MGKFEYVARSSCICGTLLSRSMRSVVAPGAWGDVRFLRCDSCGSWCQSPQVAAASLGSWYDSDEYQGSSAARGMVYANYFDDEAERLVEARRRFTRDLQPLLPPPPAAVLEIGCATGSLLRVARDAGHAAYGVDLSARFATAARRLHDIEVQVGDFRDAAIPRGLDMVALFGTLPNITDLPSALQAIHGLLRPGGVVVANYPTADGALARLYGRRFWMFTPSVSTFPTARGCQRALQRARFRIEIERTDRQMPSARKLLTHGGLGAMVPTAQRLGLTKAALPLPVPVFGVRFVAARAV